MVFLPLSDDNPRLIIRYPYVTWALIGLNVAIYVVFQSGFVRAFDPAFALSWGIVPTVVTGHAVLPPELQRIPAWATFITALFLHGDLFHLAGNLLFLWVFGDNIEDSMGHARYAAFYLLCGLAGGAAYAFSVPLSSSPMIGASSAVSGIVAAYLLLHPRVKLWILLLGRIPLRVTASWIISAWLVVQLASGYFGLDQSVGWWAHLGGFVAGAALIGPFKRHEVAWFGRPAKMI